MPLGQDPATIEASSHEPDQPQEDRKAIYWDEADIKELLLAPNLVNNLKRTRDELSEIKTILEELEERHSLTSVKGGLEKLGLSHASVKDVSTKAPAPDSCSDSLIQSFVQNTHSMLHHDSTDKRWLDDRTFASVRGLCRANASLRWKEEKTLLSLLKSIDIPTTEGVLDLSTISERLEQAAGKLKNVR